MSSPHGMPPSLLLLPTEIHLEIVVYLGAHARYEFSCTNRHFRSIIGPLSHQIAHTWTYPKFHLTVIRMGQNKFHHEEGDTHASCLHCRRYLPVDCFCWEDVTGEVVLRRRCIECMLVDVHLKQKDRTTEQKLKVIEAAAVYKESLRVVGGTGQDI